MQGCGFSYLLEGYGSLIMIVDEISVKDTLTIMLRINS